MKSNIFVKFTLLDDSDSNRFFSSLAFSIWNISDDIGVFRKLFGISPSLHCQASMILNIFSVNYSKMSVVGIEPAHLRSVSLCFTNEPHLLFLIKSKITVCTSIQGIQRYSSQV